MKKLSFTLMISALLFGSICFAKTPITNRAEIKTFINEMVAKHGFEQSDLEALFKKVQINQTIIDQMNHPAEGKPWHQYQKIFISEQFIQNGVKFWRENEETLKAAEKKYGVPPEIIVGILGVETRYGANTGKFSVIEALTTLSFDYPKRAPFFKKELEQYLLLTKEEQFDPMSLKGSYAGAMGKAQFMPSSYRHYAVDFHNKGQKDILNNTPDAIGSVANYFKQNGWQANQPVLVNALVHSDKHSALPKDRKNPKPTLTVLEWIKNYDVSPTEDLPTMPINTLTKQKAALIELDGQAGKEYFLGLNNFYVITRYNHSDQYAMAVHQLGELIKNRISQKG